MTRPYKRGRFMLCEEKMMGKREYLKFMQRHLPYLCSLMGLCAMSLW